MKNSKVINQIDYKIVLHLKDGSTETIEKKSWLLPSQIELALREEFDDNAEDVKVNKIDITWEEN